VACDSYWRTVFLFSDSHAYGRTHDIDRPNCTLKVFIFQKYRLVTSADTASHFWRMLVRIQHYGLGVGPQPQTTNTEVEVWMFRFWDMRVNGQTDGHAHRNSTGILSRSFFKQSERKWQFAAHWVGLPPTLKQNIVKSYHTSHRPTRIPLLQMSVVSWSACWAHWWAVPKRLNQSRCCLEGKVGKLAWV